MIQLIITDHEKSLCVHNAEMAVEERFAKCVHC